MKTIFIYLLLILCSATTIIAQNDTVISVENSPEVAKDFSRRTQSIKLNPLLIPRGDIPLYYEIRVINKLTVEAGLGFTINDYIVDMMDDISWNNYEDVEVENRIGYSYRISARFYAADYDFDFEGLYFELKYRSQAYFGDIKKVYELSDLSENLKRTNNDLSFSIGYSFVFEENAFIDPFLGFGFRSRNYDTIDLDSNSTTGFSIENNKDIVPLITIGLKVGILF